MGSGAELTSDNERTEPTVILISLDGVRADYLEKGLTPHLLDISRKGLVGLSSLDLATRARALTLTDALWGRIARRVPQARLPEFDFC